MGRPWLSQLARNTCHISWQRGKSCIHSVTKKCCLSQKSFHIERHIFTVNWARAEEGTENMKVMKSLQDSFHRSPQIVFPP